MGATFENGTAPNFAPAPGLAPTLQAFTRASAGVAIQPTLELKLDVTYSFNGLRDLRERDTARAATLFSNHLTRASLNYQFNQRWSLRGIVDCRAILPDRSRVSLERQKRLIGDMLLTDLVSPGTALYAGYTEGFEHLQQFASNADPVRIGPPTHSVSRQLFIKSSYVVRFRTGSAQGMTTDG